VIRLYVWASHGGGLSVVWAGWERLDRAMMSFVLFGRYGGGWAPFGRLDDAARAKYAEGARRFTERYGVPVELLYGVAPPEVEAISCDALA
jgi:hypothetical protein